MIYLEIVVEKDNQKGILIGKVGIMPPGCRACCRSASTKWTATGRTTVHLGSIR
jgi:GTPase Era involved in 16S rRNA processing